MRLILVGFPVSRSLTPCYSLFPRRPIECVRLLPFSLPDPFARGATQWNICTRVFRAHALFYTCEYFRPCSPVYELHMYYTQNRRPTHRYFQKTAQRDPNKLLHTFKTYIHTYIHSFIHSFIHSYIHILWRVSVKECKRRKESSVECSHRWNVCSLVKFYNWVHA